MKGKDRATLRAEAHHLDPAVHIGGQGINDALIASLQDVLRTRELVKVKIGKGSDLEARDAADVLSKRTRSEVIQVIGRTLTMYRFNPELHE